MKLPRAGYMRRYTAVVIRIHAPSCDVSFATGMESRRDVQVKMRFRSCGETPPGHMRLYQGCGGGGVAITWLCH